MVFMITRAASQLVMNSFLLWGRVPSLAYLVKMQPSLSSWMVLFQLRSSLCSCIFSGETNGIPRCSSGLSSSILLKFISCALNLLVLVLDPRLLSPILSNTTISLKDLSCKSLPYCGVLGISLLLSKSLPLRVYQMPLRFLKESSLFTEDPIERFEKLDFLSRQSETRELFLRSLSVLSPNLYSIFLQSSSYRCLRDDFDVFEN